MFSEADLDAALRAFEGFHQWIDGSAAVDDLKKSSCGLQGWINYAKRAGKQRRDDADNADNADDADDADTRDSSRAAAPISVHKELMDMIELEQQLEQAETELAAATAELSTVDEAIEAEQNAVAIRQKAYHERQKAAEHALSELKRVETTLKTARERRSMAGIKVERKRKATKAARAKVDASKTKAKVIRLKWLEAQKKK